MCIAKSNLHIAVPRALLMCLCMYEYVYEMSTANEVYNVRVCNIHICMYVGLIVYDLMYAQVYDRCLYMLYNVDDNYRITVIYVLLYSCRMGLQLLYWQPLMDIQQLWRCL